MEFDDIVVGAGSSGAVLAARLTEDPSRKVLLLEAGPDYPSLESTPKDLLGPDPSLVDHDWDLQAAAVGDRRIPFPRGKAVGGSSAVNGAVALRGVPADYDEWAALGNPEWAWRSVLPFFKRLESDELGETDLHGSAGPIPVRRSRLSEFCATQRAAHGAFRSLGFGEVADHNEPESTGVGPIPLNLRDQVRVSTSIAYLLPARRRANLVIRDRCLVSRVTFSGERATGVEASVGGSVQTFSAKRVTLSAGAIHTPAILVRSGIGPRADLQRLGVDVVLDRPGVGARLIDHPGVGIYAVPRSGAWAPGDPNHQTMVRYTASGSAEFNDMQLFFFGRIALKTGRLRTAIGADQTYLAAASLVRPRSAGRLLIRSLDPASAPLIDLNFCSHPEDLRRLMEGLRLCWRALRASGMAERIEQVPRWTEQAQSSDEVVRSAVLASVGTSYHPVGTVPMGPERDEGAVVDQHCCVRGVEGLRVVDASVMPTIPRANTNLPCMMIGERAAAWMRHGS